MDIKVTVNNKEMTVPSGTTVNNLLNMLDYSSRVGIWINEKQLLSADYPDYKVQDRDQISIKRIIAGG